jgi:hypothetical protein
MSVRYDQIFFEGVIGSEKGEGGRRVYEVAREKIMRAATSENGSARSKIIGRREGRNKTEWSAAMTRGRSNQNGAVGGHQWIHGPADVYEGGTFTMKEESKKRERPENPPMREEEKTMKC